MEREDETFIVTDSRLGCLGREDMTLSEIDCEWLFRQLSIHALIDNRLSR